MSGPKEALEGFVYQDPTKRFSFVYPDGFTATALPSDAAQTILVQNTKTGEGIQIMITPFGSDDIDVTADDIHASLPDLSVKDAKAVMPQGGRPGLEFTGDNPAFGGTSREIWFVWKGSLYQMSTYERYAGLLDKMFAGWRFGRTQASESSK